MNVQDIRCPLCGRPDISSPLKNHISLDEEEFTNINLSENFNSIWSIFNDPKYQYTTSENNNINSNTIYSIDNFKFSIINAKNETNAKKEIHECFKKAEVKKRFGRKTKRSAESTTGEDNSNHYNPKEKVHDRFSDDNMRKKCKNLILKYLLEFINDKIRIEYNNNIGHGNSEKNLKTLNQKFKKKATISSDREFINKTLEDIFSQNISDRFRIYSLDHNKLIIKSLINEEDEIKRNYFTKLFNLTFRDCLINLRGDTYLEELEGFVNLAAIKDYLLKKYDKGYAEYFIYYIANFEKMLNKRDKSFQINKE